MTDEYGYRGWMGGGEDIASDRLVDVELPAERSGVDEMMAVVWTTIFAVATTVSLGMAIYHASDAWALIAAGTWIGGLVAATCTRWQVRVTTAAVEFRRWECGIPLEKKRFLLDVEVDIYDSWWTSWEPEGIEVYDPRDPLTETTGCFGPHFSEAAQLELVGWLNAALQKARAWSGKHDMPIRCPEVEAQLAGVRPDRWGHSGEVREATATRSMTLVGVPVSEGSTVLFNDDRPVRDPRREDTLSGVRLSEEAVLPNGFELRSGVLVSFVGDSIWVHDNGQGRVRCDGLVYYVDDVMFDAEWHPTRFTLAEPVVVDGFEIPAESDVSRIVGLAPESYWFHVRLAEPVVHDGVTYERGRALFFDSSKRFLQPHSPRLLDASFDPGLQTAGSTEDWKMEEEEGC